MTALNPLQLEILKLFDNQSQSAEDLIALRKALYDFLKKKNRASVKSLEKKIFAAVKEKVLAIDDTAKVILFGSRARGDARKDSDWDFLILTSKEVTFALKTEFRHSIYDVELETSEAISTIIQNKNDWDKQPFLELHKNIAEDGVEI